MISLPAQLSRPRRTWRSLSAASVALGITFLLIQYLWRQSYWGDEVAILQNIITKRFSQLFQGGLNHSQAAPPLFLAAQKLMWLAAGPGEYSQRFLPVLFGIGALIAFAALSWRLLPPAPATLCLALLCWSDKFIWHATEAKQYSGDLLCAIVLLYSAAPTISPARRPEKFLALSLSAAILLWLSHTVIFIYASLSLIALIQLPRQRRKEWFAYLSGNFIFFLSFAALYFLSIRHQRDDAYLQDFWRTSFVDWSHPLHIPLWLVLQLWSVCAYVMTPITPAAIILFVLIALGISTWIRRRQWKIATLCLAPLGWVIIAAAAGLYPLAGARVDLFLIPGLLLAAGEGAAMLWRIIPSPLLPLTLLTASLLLPLLFLDARAIFFPRVRTHLRPVIEQLRLRRAPDEPIFTSSSGELFRAYWPDAAPPASDGLPPPTTAGQRFWYITGGKPENLMREEQPNLQAISLHAAEITADRIAVRGGTAFHFQENSR